MKRIVQFLTTLILITGVSCNPINDFSLRSITELYDGRISIAKGIRASTSEGKVKYLNLAIGENEFIASGWLLPESIANNCAILLLKENPEVFHKVDLLEVEIINTKSNLFSYRQQDLHDKGPVYSKMEKMVDDFVNMLEANKIEEAVSFMKSDSNTNVSEVATFLKTVRSVLPSKHKTVRLIGYRENNEYEKGYEIDFVVISQDNVQRMFKATIVEERMRLIFYSITI